MSSQLLDEIAVLRARIAELERADEERKEAESALRESRARLRTVIAHAPVVLFALNAEGIVTLSEGKGLESLGVKPGEHVGLSVFELYKDHASIVENCRRALRGEAFTAEAQLPTAAFETRFTPLRDANGEVSGCIGVATDISERIKAQRERRESEEKFRLLAENIPGVIYLCRNNARYTVIYLNEAMKDLTGYSSEQFLKDAVCFKDIIHPDDLADVYRQVDEALSARRTFHLIYRMVCIDGRVIWVEEHGVGVFQNDELKYLEGYITDITARVESERALAQSRDELERRVIERTANLKAANEKALRTQEELAHVLRVATVGELAGGLAHELNQPLSAMNNYIQGARRRIESKQITQEMLLGAFDRIAVQADRAASIVRSVRKYLTRQGGGAGSCDLNQIVRSAVELLDMGVRDHEVRITLTLADDLPAVEADAVQIEQVILNLLRNAVEALASMPADRRMVKIITRVVDGQEVEAVIEDSGPGLCPEMASKVFKPFFTSKPQGLGMGLSISRSIIESHHGRFWFGNITRHHGGAEEVHGARFHFTLPLQRRSS